jgi:predicted GH43/DUF377 family glycosyl hydrolase
MSDERAISVPKELAEATKEKVVLDVFISPEHERHDPSNIIKHDGKYYVWFTEHPKGTSGWAKSSTIQYATSSDGYDWTIEGTAVSHGQPGEWDEQGTLTAYVVPNEGKFHLFYTGVGPEFKERHNSKTGIGYAIADSPEGPWDKCAEPILWPTDDEWECLNNDDTNIIYREGKWWLYFKGKPRNNDSAATQIGVAISENLTGPYEKHPANPLFKGHALTAWVHRDGVAAMTGFDVTGELLWSEDGIHFVKVKDLRNKSTGVYCPNNFKDGSNDDGVTWGFDVQAGRPRYIYRFNADMTVR